MEKEFLAHDDIVRGFCEVPQLNAFASISNDETVKLWSLDGSHMMDYRGHAGFIFSVDCLETGEIVTGGDEPQTLNMSHMMMLSTKNRVSQATSRQSVTQKPQIPQ